MSEPSRDKGMEYALQTRGVTKRFGGVTAVDDLSLSIPRTGMTAIVGPNGSGKSTLINLLSGMLPLDGGAIVVDGVGLKVIRAHEIPGLGITRDVSGREAVRPDKRVGQHPGGAHGAASNLGPARAHPRSPA